MLGTQHIPQGCVKLAVDSGGKLGAPIRQGGLFAVFDVDQRIGKAGLFRVEHIGYTVIQTCFDGDDLVIGHS